jgi:hypothetical protein
MNGLLTNSELIDSVLDDLNNALKAQASGQYVQSCIIVSNIAQKLVNLRKTIDNDLKDSERHDFPTERPTPKIRA